MDGHRRARSRYRTRLTGRSRWGSTLEPGPGEGSSVLVRSEDVAGRALVADRRRRVEVAERHRSSAVGVEALDVVDAILADGNGQQPPERAAADAVRRELVGPGRRIDRR